MEVIANVSFCGATSMTQGEKRDIKDEKVLDDLLKAGYVSAVVPSKKETTKTAKKK